MGLTSKQWFQIISGTISGLITAGALFTTLFGQDMTLKIIACLGLVNITLASIGTAVSGPANLVKDVAAMPSVDKITVNTSASSSVAAVAVDPLQSKVGPAAGTRDTMETIAKGA